MKKLLKKIFILILVVAVIYFVYVNYIDAIPKIDVEKEKVAVEEYYIYGNHLNIKGNLDIINKDYKDINLILYNGKEKNIDITTNIENNKIVFYTSEYINEGFYLDNLNKGNYYLLLKLTYDNKENPDKPITKYYILNNKTDYNETTYYTLSKYNNKILINSDNDYNTMSLKVTSNNEKEIYDITIDPGHGGIDSGAIGKNYNESKLTMEISTLVKQKLEKEGIKVKLTHEENDLTSNDYFDEYNKHGRAVIPNEVKSKYTLSIHFNTNNSAKVHGVELYTPNNINYEFAKSIINGITSKTDLDYSNNKLHKIDNGVYTHNFTDNEIASSIEGFKNKKYKPYNITTNSNFLYMIRETGGYLTGAYVDDRNPNTVGVNPYYNSNIGNESYLLEVCYVSNQNDLNILNENKKQIATAISNSIIKEIGKEQ